MKDPLTEVSSEDMLRDPVFLFSGGLQNRMKLSKKELPQLQVGHCVPLQIRDMQDKKLFLGTEHNQ